MFHDASAMFCRISVPYPALRSLVVHWPNYMAIVGHCIRMSSKLFLWSNRSPGENIRWKSACMGHTKAHGSVNMYVSAESLGGWLGESGGRSNLFQSGCFASRWSCEKLLLERSGRRGTPAGQANMALIRLGAARLSAAAGTSPSCKSLTTNLNHLMPELLLRQRHDTEAGDNSCCDCNFVFLILNRLSGANVKNT